MTTIKANDLEVGDRYRLTGDACNPAERADIGVYEVLNIEKKSMSIPDLEQTNLPFGEVQAAMRAGTWTGPVKMFPSHTLVRVRAEDSTESDRVIAPWVPLIKVEVS